MALCCSCSSIALFRMSHLFFLNNLLIIVIIVALAVVVFLYWDPMDQKMSSEKDPRLIAVFEISIDFLKINWEFVQQYHARWSLNRVHMFFSPGSHLRSHMFCAYTNKFVKEQEEEEKKGGVPDLSNLIQLVSVQRRQGWSTSPPCELELWEVSKYFITSQVAPWLSWTSSQDWQQL